jgi:hypothetical protein
MAEEQCRRCAECAHFHAYMRCGRAFCTAVWLEMTGRDLQYYRHDNYTKKLLRGNRRPMVTFAGNVACPKFIPTRCME